MMPEQSNYLLLGGGLASAQAAKAIRGLDKEGHITIIGWEKYAPYDRPPLSKDMLHKPEMTADDIASVDEKFYDENDVTLVKGVKAEKIDRAAKVVYASDGNRYGYEKMLIATGSTPKKLEASGDGGDRVLYLRTFDDSVKLRENLDNASTAVLVGAGYIGMEVVDACIQKNVQATIVEPNGQPWSKFASKTLGGFLQTHFEKLGVKFLFSDEVVSVGAMSVGTKNGVTLPADLVLGAVGVIYNTGIAADAGLEVDEKKRIKADKTLRTTLDDSIWTAGDIAAYFDELLGKEFNAEHYMNAMWQGEQAGKNMAGAGEPYARIPYFFSDMGSLHMILRGNSDKADDTRIVGSMVDEDFVELYRGDQGLLAMAIAISHDEEKLEALNPRLEALIRDKAKVDEIGDDAFAV